MIAQWDDHEVLNNWYPGEVLGAAGTEARYTEKQVSVLAARARQAFFDYAPIRGQRGGRAAAAMRGRSIASSAAARWPTSSCSTAAPTAGRTPRTCQPAAGPETAMLAAGAAGLARGGAGARRRATWKIVACDQPIGVVVPDGPLQEGFANDDPRTLGREHEIAALLTALQAPRASATCVFVTADVHYAAAHRYDPARATYTDFDPFWEFVAGPLHAGTFGPGALDATFGPEAVFTSVGAGAEPAAERRAAVLRPGGDRSGDARRDGDAARPGRPDALHEGAGPRRDRVAGRH